MQCNDRLSKKILIPLITFFILIATSGMTSQVLANDEKLQKRYIDLTVAKLQYQILSEITDTVDNRHVLLGLSYALSNKCPDTYKKEDWKAFAPHLARDREINIKKLQNNTWFTSANKYIEVHQSKRDCQGKLFDDIWKKSIRWIYEESDWEETRVTDLMLVSEERSRINKVGMYLRNAVDPDVIAESDPGIRKTVKDDISEIGDRTVLVCRYARNKTHNLLFSYLFWTEEQPAKELLEKWKRHSSNHTLLKIPVQTRKTCPSTAKESEEIGAKQIVRVYGTIIKGYYLMKCAYDKEWRELTLWHKRVPALAILNKQTSMGMPESPGMMPILALSECPTSRIAMSKLYAEFTIYQ